MADGICTLFNVFLNMLICLLILNTGANTDYIYTEPFRRPPTTAFDDFHTRVFHKSTFGTAPPSPSGHRPRDRHDHKDGIDPAHWGKPPTTRKPSGQPPRDRHDHYKDGIDPAHWGKPPTTRKPSGQPPRDRHDHYKDGIDPAHWGKPPTTRKPSGQPPRDRHDHYKDGIDPAHWGKPPTTRKPSGQRPRDRHDHYKDGINPARWGEPPAPTTRTPSVSGDRPEYRPLSSDIMLMKKGIKKHRCTTDRPITLRPGYILSSSDEEKDKANLLNHSNEGKGDNREEVKKTYVGPEQRKNPMHYIDDA